MTAALTSMLAEGLTYPKLLLLLFANKLTFISKVAQKGRLDVDSKIQSIFFGVMGEIIFYQDKDFINSQSLPKLITAAVTSFGIMSALEVMSFSRNYSQQTVEAVKLASIASVVGGLSGAMAWTAGATSESQVVVTAGLLGAAISGGMSYRKRF